MKRQLFSTEVWVFIAVLIIAIIIAVVYAVLAVDRPTDLQRFNALNPFPTIRMEHIPAPKFLSVNPSIENCTEQVVPCATDNDCTSACGSDLYSCTPVEDSDNVIYHGKKVGAGNWCLPKNKLSACGKYTGQVVWSGEPSGEQEWQCICKYPSLFGGPEDPYCINKRACQDPNPEAQNINQNNNQLTNSKGEVYDPNLPNFYPPDGIANPYALDKDGNPVYTCRCGVGSNNARFVSLPNDPQGCNLDPCTASHSSPLWSEENQTCVCGIDGVIKKDGVCQPVSCAYGFWNPLTQQCECQGALGKVRCNPEEPIWNDEVPKCDDPKNTAGWECIPRCIVKYCDPDKPVRECGGEDGYRPEFFEDGQAIVCVGGNCCQGGDCNPQDPSGMCCDCPDGTVYQNQKGEPDYGVCLGSGVGPGRGCYMGGRSGRRGRGEGHVDNLRWFWVSYSNSDPGHGRSRWVVEEIDYDNSQAVPGASHLTFGQWRDQMEEKGDDACGALCEYKDGGAGRSYISDADYMETMLNAMQDWYENYYANEHPGSSRDKQAEYAKYMVKQRFICNYCTNENNDGEYKWRDNTQNEPCERARRTHGGPDYDEQCSKFFGNKPDWACGFMCNGEAGVDPYDMDFGFKVPAGQCGEDRYPGTDFGGDPCKRAES